MTGHVGRRGAGADPVRALSLCFAGLGLAGSTWASRLAQVRAQLGLSAPELGVLLVTVAVGGLAVLPFSGRVADVFGPRRCLRVLAVLLAASMMAVAAGCAGSLPLLVVGLVGLGAATGLWDVAVTVEATAMEIGLGRPLMPGFYAAFSIGTIVGALVGVAAAAVRLPVAGHVVGIAFVVLGGVWVAAEQLPKDRAQGLLVEGGDGRVLPSRPWREPRTVAIGLLVLAFAAAEGGGGSWIAVTTVEARHASPTFGSAAYAVFLSALTVSRLTGGWAVRRCGRTAVVRAATATAAAGVVVFSVATGPTVAVVGVVLWGLGAALGFPIGLSAAGDGPGSTTRISAVTGLGYGGFLAGPPAVGAATAFLGGAHGLLVIAVALILVLPLAPAVRATDLVCRDGRRPAVRNPR